MFASELEAIVDMDTFAAADKAGPLPADVISDYEASMQWSRRMENLPASKTSDVKVFVEKVQHSAHLKRHLATLDLAHKWKIDAVQCKYQEHMESVRFTSPASNTALPMYRTGFLLQYETNVSGSKYLDKRMLF